MWRFIKRCTKIFFWTVFWICMAVIFMAIGAAMEDSSSSSMYNSAERSSL